MLNYKSAARLVAALGLCASMVVGAVPAAAIAEGLADDTTTAEAAGTADSSAPADPTDPAEPTDAEDGTVDPASDSVPIPVPTPVMTLGTPAPVSDGAPAGYAVDVSGNVTISDLEALRYFRDQVNSGADYRNKTVTLAADINLGNEEWAPIGTSEHRFTGTFVSTGHVISNLTVNMPEAENVGLFGMIADPAKLVDITVENATVTGKSNVGVIAGAAFTGSASGCTVKGSINVTGNYKVGGMFGGGYIKLNDCHVEATGSVTGKHLTTDFEGDNVGGLIGFRGEGSTITTTNCSVSGITIAGSRKVGGIVGSAFVDNTYDGCSVSNLTMICNAPASYANGIAGNQLCVGGLVGIFMKSGNAVGSLANSSVSNIAFSASDPEVAAANKAIFGLVSGGYRASSFSGASAPDGKVQISNVTVSGTNTGTNAEQKFPGSIAMNGTSSVFAQGSGTAEDPYVIASIDELKLFRETVNGTGLTYEDQYLKVADGVEFDLSGEKWTPIGTSTKKFMGTFDGNGATVKGLTKGLFGYVQNATVKNLNLVDVNVSAAAALIQNATDAIHVSGVTVSGVVSTSGDVAGIVGVVNLRADGAQAEISNCTNNATISAKSGFSTPAAGGIIGAMKVTGADTGLTVTNCTNNGAISGQIVGGICAESQHGTFDGCKNTGALSGAQMKATPVVGGIVGTANAGTAVKNSSNTADVTSEDRAGGIIGVSSSGGNTLSACANTGDVSGAGDVGGISGGSYGAGDYVDNCYNGGSVTTTGTDAIAAGIFSDYSGFAVKACFNDGAVSAENGTAYEIGRGTGSGDNALTDCYYADGDTFFSAAANGSGPGTEQTGMTRGKLADALNAAGGVDGFWQAQNGSVQPDPLIPGVWDDDEGVAVVELLDAEGSVVERYDSFEAAAAAVKEGQTIKLVKNVTVDGKLNINVAVNIDLNGCVLTGTDSVYSLGLKGAGTSRVFDSSADKSGKIVNAASRALVIDGPGVEVVLDDVTVEAGLYVAQVSGAAKVTLKGGTYTGADAAFAMYGTKDEANKDKPTTITVEQGAVLTGGKSYAISSNGSASYLGPVNIYINGGELLSKGADGGAVYMPSHGEFVMTDGYLEGAQGVQICDAATVKISGGTIKATNPNTIASPSKEGDGIVEDGAALSIVSRGGGYGAAGTATVEITGGTFVAAANPAIREYGFGSIAGSLAKDMSLSGDVVVTNLKAGAPALEVSLLKGEAAKVVSGGTYSAPLDESNLVDGFGLLEKDENGNYVVHQHEWLDEFESDESGHWHKCAKCDATTEVSQHTEKTTGAKDATCGADGYTGDVTCADCGYVIKKGSVIPATGKHTAGDGWKTDGASHWHECIGCDAKLDEAEHTSDEWITNPTNHWHVCDVCDAAYDVDAHEFGEWRVTKEATATEPGSREHACKVCGRVVSEEIPALGEKPSGEPDKLPGAGDASVLGVAATGIAGALVSVAGVVARRRSR